MKPGIMRVPVAKLLVFLLAVGLVLSCLAPVWAAAADDSVGSAPLTVSLGYQVTPYTFINSGLSATSQGTPFKKEPQLGKGTVRRGRLEFSAAGQPALAFIWDQSRGDLYLDLNRNEDLTDDPAGVFHTRISSASGSTYRHALFTNVQIAVQTKAGAYPWLADLNLSDYNGQLNLYGAQKSLWSAKVNLGGREYQLGVITGLAERLEGSSSGHLLLRPWDRKDEPFEVSSGALETFPFAGKVFFDSHLYQIERAWLAEGGKLDCQLKLTEQPAALGELQLSGKYIHRLLLTGGPCVAVLDSPGEVVRVPVGRYQNYQVQLGQGNAAAYLDRPYGFRENPVAVSSNSLARLTAGGPLTNSVSISRRGQFLVLNYRLLGAGGQAYQLKSRDYQNPPRYTVYQGERQLASGKFEFG